MKIYVALMVLVLIGSFSCQKNKKSTPKKPVKKIIPLTVANMKGHKLLYNKGWYIVTSTDKSLKFAYNKGILSSKHAIVMAAKQVVKDSKSYKTELKGDLKKSYDLAVSVLKTGTSNSKFFLEGTHEFAKFTYKYSKKGFSAAWGRFLKGNLTLAARTKEDRRRLISLPGKFYNNLKEDFSNIFALTSVAVKKIGDKIEVSWSKSLKEAGIEFNKEYEESGKKENSLMALVNIFKGYGKAIYYGLIKPGTKTVAKGAVKAVGYGVFLPASSAILLTGRTIQTTGLTLYYSTKLGIKLLSPTIEGGILTALSVMGMGMIPVEYVAGGTLAAINQVTVTAFSPAYGVGRAATTTTADTLKYAAMVLYTTTEGSAKILYNTTLTGIVLGYNALTAIPAHLYLATIDSAIFLAWDGPRLVIAAVQGNIGSNKSNSVGELPVGSIVDLKKLRKEKGIKIKIISRDMKTIKKVLKKLPKDLNHEKGEKK